MRTLQQLVDSVNNSELHAGQVFLDGPVVSVTCDSRQVRHGSVFVALRGEQQDGHEYVGEAVEKGCCAVVVEKMVKFPGTTSVIRVTDTHRAYGQMAAAFYGYPARELTLIGLTGTNGKTTTSWIIEEMLVAGDYRPGVIGTVNYRYIDKHGQTVVREAALTTPEPVMLHALLREMKNAGVTHVVMEVSSHALDQKRLAGTVFDAAVFTNLSRDHLDYHRNMEEYFAAKKKLFLDHLKQDGFAVVVVDGFGAGEKERRGGWGQKLFSILAEKGFAPYTGKQRGGSLISCGFHEGCAVRVDKMKQDIDGSTYTFMLGGRQLQLHSDLIGQHNVLNMLTAAGVGMGLGMKSEVIERGLARVRQVPGRLERVQLPPYSQQQNLPRVFVDYAHTPDALENVLQTLQAVTPGRLICVFGCGGDRDRGKRPMMGEVAGRLADRILITSDNPRTENPASIIREIESGITKLGVELTDVQGLFGRKSRRKKYSVLEDRHQAIHTACAIAGGKDVVLIAGKGHETYQITADGKRFFDDRLEAKNSRMRWTMKYLAAATSGKVEQHGTALLLGDISTDTRTLQAGDVFLALKGENFDGHDFIDAAVKRGAAALIVSECCRIKNSNIGVIRVIDTLRALGDLAHHRRRVLAPEILVIGITGSSGKTTVKEMTAAIFQEQHERSGQGEVLKTKGNLNNLVGLPLSLLEVNAGHGTAVLEMGMNRPGEIERLAKIADPDIGCITNVQAAHLEGLGSIEGVARAKGELFTAMSVPGIRVINCDDPYIRPFGGNYGNNVIGFAVTSVGRRHHPEVRATRIISLGEAGMRFTLHIKKWQKRITVPATGTHNVANCAAAAAIATAAGLDQEIIVKGLMHYRSGEKRLQISELPGGVKVLNDSYNANPASMGAALQTIRGFGHDCRRIAALGDMLELGESAAEAHRKIGSLIAKLGFDFLVVTGNYAQVVASAARKAGMKKNRIMTCKTTEDAARWIAGLVEKKRLRRGDWLLVKGSRGMKMEQVLTFLHNKLAKS